VNTRSTFPSLVRSPIGHAVLVLSLFALLAPPLVAGEGAKRVMEATCKIFHPDSTGTGFLFESPSAVDRKANRYILVTATHILTNIKSGPIQLVLRDRKDDGSYERRDQEIAIRDGEKPLWFGDDKRDVSMLLVEIPRLGAIRPLPIRLLARDADIDTRSLMPADRVVGLVYPHRVEANTAAFPIARQGAIATWPLTPHAIYPKMMIDMNAFDGDSGGPILIEADKDAGDDADPMIIGLVSAKMQFDEKVETSREERVSHYPMHLAIVVQSGVIRELLDQHFEKNPD
jgi:hypothetical protein